MKYTLAPGWTMVRTATQIVLSSEETELKITLEKNLSLAMRKLFEGWAPNEVPELEPLRMELARRGVLRPLAIAAVPEQERQIEYWRAFTDDASGAVANVCSATVAIVGVGGIGAVVLQHLVGAGVRRFRLLDADDVEPSNLNRQFIYDQASVGQQKVDAARAYVMDRLPAAEVSVLAASWDPRSDMQRSFVSHGVDFVVAAID
ncbi:ThiF family adenylyltransferase [Arthrobacter sp. MA-N2]|uniref:ThiF family adenylyltransferase n=1 Tax=Arthrobacter sp. MA-N2 TaxID=1101188 RepID=UPI00047F04E7|nr:ThiF family adenylyltransferase [Arthrobacter sp. MA-N2]